jgi:hypothetical protein
MFFEVDKNTNDSIEISRLVQTPLFVKLDHPKLGSEMLSVFAGAGFLDE